MSGPDTITERPARLSQLLAACPGAVLRGDDVVIHRVCDDSRQVVPGALFVAVPGFVSDGHDHIAQALTRGAAALVVQQDHLPALPGWPVPIAAVPDSRAALSHVAAAYYGYPGRRMRVIGVTGTDGKTTTSYLINAVLEGADRRTGLFGTVAHKVDAEWIDNPTRLTTPGALEVQALLARMVAGGVEYAIVESTSHGLELHRLDDCDYDVGVFTNLTPDHLDLHGSIEAYRAAKARLFEMLGQPTEKTGSRYAVLNADDPTSEYLRGRVTVPVVSYSLQADADVCAAAVAPRPDVTHARIVTRMAEAALDLPLPGLFNVSNALAAVAVAVREGVPLDAVARSLSHFSGVPGRMERIDAGQPFAVIVDYAHTGDALRKVLKTLRPATRGQLIVVFGSAGERGHSRRLGMGEAAAELADFSILTDEDPRFEDPEAILAEISAAMGARGRDEPQDFVRIVDRQQAIDAAIRRARPDDLVLLAGKGHEQTIEMRGEKLPWDDRAAARRALAACGYVAS